MDGSKRAMLRVILLLGLAYLLSLSMNPVLKFVSGTEYPLSVVVSGSMRPSLNVGDLVVVKAVPPSELKVGDVIVFHNPLRKQELIVHRIVDIVIADDGKRYFNTKGDANFLTDKDRWGVLVPEDLVEGKVVFVIPYIGLLRIALDSLMSPLVLYLLIVALMVSVVFFETRELRKGGSG